MNNLLALAQHLGLEVFEFQGDYYKGATQLEIDEMSLGEAEKFCEETATLLEDELKEASHDSNIIEYGSEEYLVVDDSTTDDLWDQELENYIDECILPEVPESVRNYFDNEAWKRDAKYDGRAHSLARYDGNEGEETVNGETFYIYRQN